MNCHFGNNKTIRQKMCVLSSKFSRLCHNLGTKINIYNSRIFSLRILPLVSFTSCFSLIICRKVYDELLKKGEIVIKPEVTPPTVPMDYNWARVSKYQTFNGAAIIIIPTI